MCRDGLAGSEARVRVIRALVMSSSAGKLTSVEDLLREARAGLTRLSPAAAEEAQRRGAVLIDIRADDHRRRDGQIPQAVHVPRNGLEWRCDPSSPHRVEAISRRDQPLVLICDEGYQSSLAAATLNRFGLQCTDVGGGFQAWRAAGLPVATSRTGAVPPDAGRTPDR